MNTLKDYLENNKVYSSIKAIEVESIPLGNILISNEGYPHFFSFEELEELKRLVDTTLACYEFGGWDDETIRGINERTFAAESPSWLSLPLERFSQIKNRTYVYIIGNKENDFCKVGISEKPYQRLKTLQTACPYELEILEVYKANSIDESNLHSILIEKNLHTQGEWFRDIKSVTRIVDEYFENGKSI